MIAERGRVTPCLHTSLLHIDLSGKQPSALCFLHCADYVCLEEFMNILIKLAKRLNPKCSHHKKRNSNYET